MKKISPKLVKTPKLRIKQNIAGYTKFFTFSPIGTALLANAGMFIYASIILQTLEKSRKYLVSTTSDKSANSAQTTLYKQISRSLSSTSSNDSGPKLRQKQKPSIERYIFLANIIKAVPSKSSKLKKFLLHNNEIGICAKIQVNLFD